MPTPSVPQPEPRAVIEYGIAPPRRRPSLLANTLVLIAKNVLGWILILSSWALGLVSPIPIGFFLFLIGFGLIWFPGKRRLTARVLSGRRIPGSSRPFRIGTTFFALLVPTLLLIYLVKVFHLHYHVTALTTTLLCAIYIAAAVLTITFSETMLASANWLLRQVPKFRRKSRPWLRRRGIELLPPRRRTRFKNRSNDEEIIRIAERHRRRAWSVWTFLKVWGRRVIGIALTLGIFAWMLRPVIRNWDQVSERIWQMKWTPVLLAALMFSVFLFVFRAMLWRRILTGFGYKLPVAAATRIWSTSELARYLPGVIWQVVGRVYLVRPYGVSAGVCSTSQILELSIFLLSNIFVAVGSLTWLGYKTMHETAQTLLLVVTGLVPLLLLLIHPRIFYGLTNSILTRLKREPVSRQLSWGLLVALLGWSMLGLVWQSLSIWLITHGPLKLEFTKWWVVAGAYCLAWCAGFLAFWAPGGIGVRELVFVAAMQAALPKPVQQQFANPMVLKAFLVFLSVLLRLWATAGELTLAAIAYLFDLRGALNRADAPGRVPKARLASEQLPDSSPQTLGSTFGSA